MSGITSTELKLPRFRKPLWIIVIIIALLALVFFLLPLDDQIEKRVSAAVHIIPGAEFRYSDTTDQNGFMTVKKLIYWINSPFEQVKDYPFVTNYRQSSDPNKVNIFSEVTPNYSHRTYFLSDLPQKELDSILYFESDLCCYGKVPFDVTVISFYIISAYWAGDKDYLINHLDYEHLAGKETAGTYIVYIYRIR